MNFSRRQFVKGGVTAFTFGFAAPQMLCDIAFAQGVPSRNLVVVYLSGGNDSLSTVIPYRDPFYASRRPTLAIPAGNVLQIGRDSSNVELGLHPRLTGLKSIFDAGRLAIVQRTGYANQSRSHFTGFDIWGTASTSNTSGTGWLGRYLDSAAAADRSARRVEHGARDAAPADGAHRSACRRSPARPTYAFSSPNSGAEAGYERTAQTRISSHCPVDRPHLAFVNSTTQAALGTLDRVATVATYRPAVTYPNNGFGQALPAVAGAMNKQIGTKVFWVQTGGFDTHASQGANAGAYVNLMATLGDGLKAFYDDLSAQGMLNNTARARLFGVRPPHQRERQRGHRPRRRRQHDGARRPRARRHLRHGAEPQHRSGQPDAREQRRRREVRDRLPRASTRRSSTAGWERTRSRCSARTTARRAERSLSTTSRGGLSASEAV